MQTTYPPSPSPVGIPPDVEVAVADTAPPPQTEAPATPAPSRASKRLSRLSLSRRSDRNSGVHEPSESITRRSSTIEAIMTILSPGRKKKPDVSFATIVTISRAAKQFKKGLKPVRRPLPGMPIPGSLKQALAAGTPDDATGVEVLRDTILLFFANKRVSDVFLVLAVLMLLAVVSFGLLLAYAALGLFFGVDNGWGETKWECVAAWRYLRGPHATWDRTAVPEVNGTEVGGGWCSWNQWWFATCIKAFVGLFSYINFLPIPWRVSILEHAWWSHRSSAAGVDFYGRPTAALWFNIPTQDRRWISLLLNVAWLSHFLCLSMHFVWQSYSETQNFPGSLAQNLFFLLSIGSQVAAGVIQSKAEEKLIAQFPDIYPPRPIKYVLAAYRKWRRGEAKGTLVSAVRAEFADLREVRKEMGVAESSALTGVIRMEDISRRDKNSKRRISRLQSASNKSGGSSQLSVAGGNEPAGPCSTATDASSAAASDGGGVGVGLAARWAAAAKASGQQHGSPVGGVPAAAAPDPSPVLAKVLAVGDPKSVADAPEASVAEESVGGRYRNETLPRLST